MTLKIHEAVALAAQILNSKYTIDAITYSQCNSVLVRAACKERLYKAKKYGK